MSAFMEIIVTKISSINFCSFRVVFEFAEYLNVHYNLLIELIRIVKLVRQILLLASIPRFNARHNVHFLKFQVIFSVFIRIVFIVYSSYFYHRLMFIV